MHHAGCRQGIDGGLKAETGAHICLGVTQVHTGLRTVKGGWRNRQITSRRIAIGDGANVRVDAENFLQNDDSALRLANRFGNVSGQREAVSGGEVDELSHEVFLL